MPDQPAVPGDGPPLLVILDRAGEQGHRYRVVARTSCVRCRKTVLLGPATLRAVQRPGTAGLCLPCARDLVREESLSMEQRIGRVVDPPGGGTVS